MSSTTIQVTNSGTMGIYEPPKQMSMWRDTSAGFIASTSAISSSAQAEIGDENKFEYEYPCHQALEPSISGEDAIRLSEKVQRRLAQNREAARKSRLRKKAYVQQLESSRLKLAQLEQELQRVKLQIIMPQLEPLTNQQAEEINKLRHSSQQAEDALSRGMDKLQQTLTQIMFADALGIEMYGIQMASALEKLEAIEGFVNQADHLCEQTLQLMSRILTPRQAARGLLALGEYFHRLRALSALWVTRPRDSG